MLTLTLYAKVCNTRQRRQHYGTRGPTNTTLTSHYRPQNLTTLTHGSDTYNANQQHWPTGLTHTMLTSTTLTHGSDTMLTSTTLTHGPDTHNADINNTDLWIWHTQPFHIGRCTSTFPQKHSSQNKYKSRRYILNLIDFAWKEHRWREAYTRHRHWHSCPSHTQTDRVGGERRTYWECSVCLIHQPAAASSDPDTVGWWGCLGSCGDTAGTQTSLCDWPSPRSGHPPSEIPHSLSPVHWCWHTSQVRHRH